MGYNSVVTLENDYILMQEPFETLVAGLLSPKFEWLDIFPKMRLEGAESITWPKEKYSAENDPMKRLPRRLAAGADFVRVTASKLSEGQATMAKWGLEFSVSEKARRYKKNMDVVVRQIKRTTNWVGEWQNTQIIESVVDSSNGVNRLTSDMDFYKRSPVKWTEPTANPINDLLMMKYDYEDANMGYTGTDFYMSTKKFREMATYITALNVDKATRDSMYGTPTAGAGSLYIPLIEATVHKVRYGIDYGDLLLLDRDMSPITIYYDYNPEYGPSESFSMENGQVLENSFGLHSHEYRTDSNHEFVKQIWLENGVAIKDASAGMFVPNGAHGI